FRHRDRSRHGALIELAVRSVFRENACPRGSASRRSFPLNPALRRKRMATERLTMRALREILRQKLQLSRSHRAAARAAGVGTATVASAATRARVLGLDWDAVEKLDDEELETRMYGPRGGKRG